MRIVSDIELLGPQVSELMSMAERPTGLIARNLRLARALAKAVKALGLSVGEDVEIVFHDQAVSPTDRAPYAHVRPRMDFIETVKLVGKMLRELGETPARQPDHVVIPVEFREVEKE